MLNHPRSTHSGRSAPDEWFTFEGDGISLRARRAGCEPITLIWSGRAASNQLQHFIFDIRDGSSVKAIAWKQGTMIEIRQMNEIDELEEELARENATFEDARFVRFETEVSEKTQVIVWSAQGEFKPGQQLRSDGINGVGFYAHQSKLKLVMDRLVTLISDTYHGADWTYLADAARKRIVRGLLADVAERLAH